MVSFVRSGYISIGDGKLKVAGTYITTWSSLAANDDNAYYLNASQIYANPAFDYARRLALSLRCLAS